MAAGPRERRGDAAVGRALRVACLLSLIIAVGCSAPRVAAPPVPADASEAFHRARLLERAGDVPAARAAAREAYALAPDWAAPRRFLSDAARADLRGPEVLAELRARIEVEPEPTTLYLAGRLEGVAGVPRFEAATRLAPTHAWAWHGLAWRAELAGAHGRARRYGARALAEARDPYERTYFTWALAHYLAQDGEARRAAGLLVARLAEPELLPADRPWLLVHLVRIETQADDEELQRRGLARLYDTVRREDLTTQELGELARLGAHDAWALLQALAARDGEGRDALAAGWLARLERSALAFALARDAGVEASRADRMRFGDPGAAVEAWRAELPAQVLQPDGLPRDARLRALVVAARGWDASQADARAFGQALVDAGWFEEAHAFAQRVPLGDVDAARILERRAAAGRLVVRELARLGARLDQGQAVYEPELLDPDDLGRPVRGLDDLLESLGPLFARAAPELGGASDPREVARALVDSPRVGFGWIGEVVHPGSVFSGEDERLGRGPRGEPVPGLARWMKRIGRFGIFGDALGQQPDATVLRRLHVEQRAGEHLGVAWRGTVAWCDGADLEGRPGRRGASLAGAALHEGYWIDVDVLRGELARWEALRARFDDPARVAAALAQGGLPAAGDRTAAEHLLGEGDRVRLAVMHDRGQGGALVAPSLGELVNVTAVHEEGHLCDRERFYPPSEHLFGVLQILLSGGLSPVGVQEYLEERAQLVALCAIPDPRLALVDLLDAAEGGGMITPHGNAYPRLLERLLDELDDQLTDDPAAWPELAPDAMLVGQLHRLGPERLRALGLAVARRMGVALSQ